MGLKACTVCTPQCIRICPVAKRRSALKRQVPCPACGTRFDASTGFCPNCGLEVTSVCPSCGSLNTMDDGTCTSCGFSHAHVDMSFSQWYRFKGESRIGELAPPPGQEA